MDSDRIPDSAEPSKSTGPLRATGPLAAQPKAAGPRFVMSRDFALRICELAVFLTAIIGSVALGLGITAYFRDHHYVAAYLLAYGGFRLSELLVREDNADTPGSDSLGARIMDQVPILVLFAAAPFERTYIYGGEAPAWAGALGLLLELAGLWLALGARIQLHFFSSDRSGREQRVLVRRALYRYIRHPVYAGEFLVLFAWPLVYGAPIVALLTLVIGVIVARRRVRAEEATLLERFGEDYEAYRRETDALIPSIW
jgi:protein-S-isoprenylcysteine O-methyltransferase Ste14